MTNELIEAAEKLPNESWRDYAWVKRKDVLELIRQHTPADGNKIFNAITACCQDATEGSSLKNLLVSQRMALTQAVLAALQHTQGGDDASR